MLKRQENYDSYKANEQIYHQDNYKNTYIYFNLLKTTSASSRTKDQFVRRSKGILLVTQVKDRNKIGGIK